jgi:hypothetical protein
MSYAQENCIQKAMSFNTFQNFINMREQFMVDFTRSLSTYSDESLVLRPQPSRLYENDSLTTLQPSKLKNNCTGCNCKKSGCLKMYCECFKKGILCEGCCCVNCQNKPYNKANIDMLRLQCKKQLGESDCKNNKGCTCKKSGCSKGYCECFNVGTSCSENCRCENCMNK